MVPLKGLLPLERSFRCHLFLDYMEKFWVIHKDVDLKDFKSKCMKFYKDKTYQRVDNYFEEFHKKLILRCILKILTKS